jgi:hypothetical protein
MAKRMGKIEELEKGMALLENMRGIIGKELYLARLKASLPPCQISNLSMQQSESLMLMLTNPIVSTGVQKRGSLIPRQTVALVINIATSGRRARVVRLSTMMNLAFSGLTDML